MSTRSEKVLTGPWEPLGFESISNPATAQSLTPVAGAKFALISTATAAIRWRDDGTAPTATVGIALAVGEYFQYFGDLSAIQVINDGGAAVVSVAYYG